MRARSSDGTNRASSANSASLYRWARRVLGSSAMTAQRSLAGKAQISRLIYNIKRALSPVVVVADAPPRRSRFLNDPPAQRFDLRRLALARRVVAPLTGAGHRLKRPANKLDSALHAGAILFRPALPRQSHQRGQPV